MSAQLHGFEPILMNRATNLGIILNICKQEKSVLYYIHIKYVTISKSAVGVSSLIAWHVITLLAAPSTSKSPFHLLLLFCFFAILSPLTNNYIT